MSIYFSTHKKKKNFPFSLFGFLALLVWTGFVIYILQKGFSLDDFANAPAGSELNNIIGFAIIVSSFLLYFLSIGINREIKSMFKFPLYATQFIFFSLSAIAGYFFSSDVFSDLIDYLMISAVLYYLILLIYFIIQHRIYSRYYSRIIMIITVLPILPFLYGIYGFITGHSLILNAEIFSFDNIIIYALLFTVLLYTFTNSVYLSYINRRVY